MDEQFSHRWCTALRPIPYRLRRMHLLASTTAMSSAAARLQQNSTHHHLHHALFARRKTGSIPTPWVKGASSFGLRRYSFSTRREGLPFLPKASSHAILRRRQQTELSKLASTLLVVHICLSSTRVVTPALGHAFVKMWQH